MAKCKYCGEADKKWYQDSTTGKFSLLEPDGSRHMCQSFNRGQQQQTTTTTTATFEHGQPLQQPQQATQEGYASAIKALSDQITYQGTQITKLTELYNDLSQYLVEINHAAKSASISANKSLLITEKVDQFFGEAKIINAKADRIIALLNRNTWTETDPEDEKIAQQELEYDKDKEDGII